MMQGYVNENYEATIAVVVKNGAKLKSTNVDKNCYKEIRSP